MSATGATTNAELQSNEASRLAKAENTESTGQGLQAKSEEEREDLLKESAVGTNTAAGQERERLLGNETIPKGKERGSEVEIEGGDKIKPDFYGGQGAKFSQKSEGLQGEPSLMSRNGTLDPMMAPSPTGPLPAHVARAVAMDVETLENAANNSAGLQIASDQPLSDEQINSMDAATLRAVGHDRGYNIPIRGRRAARALFQREQAKDERFKAAKA